MPSKGRVKVRAETKLARKQADSLKRNPAKVKPNKLIFVVCEGEATEPDYLRHLQKEIRDRIALVIPPDHGGPMTVVRHAVASKKRVEEDSKRTGDYTTCYDEVWAVFDIDEHKNIPEARDLAAANGVQLAVSNPCFELWLLIHFREQNADIHRHDAHAALKKEFLAGYEKHLDGKMLGLLRERIGDAVERGKLLCREASRFDEPGRNPTSTVYKLIGRLLSASPLVAAERAGDPKTKRAKTQRGR